jgi:hypothetical protein
VTATTAVIDTSGPGGNYSSLTIGANGNPTISYYNSVSTELRVATIQHRSWSPNGWGR